ncbi:DUF6449 domain-containing protein [Mesobacillus foraminis]|uniref:DUF6449 domain-containing protein n=1 Tax=Mesobacillus foraminis TaxID=279826 RepID=UPI000EF4D510|nr:DUF6449 domain-containing protein [Mesobacillus foraminis]
MPSKTSLFNKELILDILRSTGWISIVYFLGLTFALPIRMLMMYTDDIDTNHLVPVRNLFEYDYAIQLGLLMVVPILLAVFMFRYLQVKPAADFMHSLPVRREKIFHHYALAGMVGLILPVAIIAASVFLLHGALSLDRYFGSGDIVYWAAATVLLSLLFFTAGVFVGMMTGISAVQAVLTYIFLVFPAGITLMVFYNLKILLFGFPSDYYMTINLDKLSPLTTAALLNERILQGWELLLFAALTLLLYCMSLYLYKRRKIESSTEAIAFPKLRSLFKYGVTFCTMLVGGVYFSEVQNNSTGWIAFGYVIGAILGYLAAEMILQKSWRVFGRVKGLAVYGAVMAILITIVQMLGIYENNVPGQDEVKSVILTDTPHIYSGPENYGFNYSPSPIEGEDNIEAVRKLHEQIVSDKKVDQFAGGEEPVETAFFLYELKNGDKVIRQYRVNRLLYEDFYKSIHESEEYRRASNEIFSISPEEVNHLTITSNGPSNHFVTINKPQEIKEIIAAIQSDILQESYADSRYFGYYQPSIEVVIQKDHFIHLNLNPSYKKLNKWLEDKDLIEKVKVMPEEVSYVQIGKYEKEKHDSFEVNVEQIAQDFEKRADVLKVTEKKQINEILNTAGMGDKHQYVAVLHFEGRVYPELLYFDEEHTPDFIKKAIK